MIDTGPGMASDVRERMFQPYFTTKAGGSGLGLPTTRRIIEAHNGEIFAENRYRTTLGPDRDVAGARLTVRLPTVSGGPMRHDAHHPRLHGCAR